MVIFLVYPNPSPISLTQHRGEGVNTIIQFAKLMWQKIAIPTFLLPHYISHFLNLLKQLRRRKYSTPQYPIYIVTILSISPFTLRLI